MVVYIDVLFAINFSMDFLSLFLCAHFTKRKIFKRRILLSAIIGALYSIIDFIFPIKSVIISITLSILVSLIMCFVAFYEKKIINLLKMFVIYWGISVSLGGFMSVLYTFLNKILAEYIAGYSYEHVYNGARFFIIISLTIIASIIFGKTFSNNKNIKNAKLYVKINEYEYELNGLCDSGNLLTEPISGKSVILVSKDSDIGKKIDNMPEISKRFIPYSTTDSKGLLKGIVPTTVKIDEISKDAIVATVNSNNFGGYDACIPMSIM